MDFLKKKAETYRPKKSQRKNDIHRMPEFIILLSIAVPLCLISYALDSYFLLILFSFFTFIYFQKISVNHGNNFRVIHLMTNSRVRLWVLLAALGMIISNSINRELDNYSTSIYEMKTQCRLETMRKERLENFKLARFSLKLLGMGAYLMETAFAEGALAISESFKLKISSSSLWGRIVHNMAKDGKESLKPKDMNWSSRANGILEAKCEDIGVTKYLMQRLFVEIIDTFMLLFKHPLLFVVSPLFIVWMVYRDIKRKRDTLAET